MSKLLTPDPQAKKLKGTSGSRRVSNGQKLAGLRAFFLTGETMSLSFRRQQLRQLEKVIMQREEEIIEALRQDLNKSPTEAYMIEIALVLQEIRFMSKHLKRLARPRFKLPGLFQLPGSLKVTYEPYGVVLIIAPWNYPFQLALSPLVAAVAAGNCVLLKPSERSPATSALLSSICAEALAPELVQVAAGSRAENHELLELRYDYIFFTGSAATGRQVMAAAARHLTPVTLELGGKSPAIVEKTADLDKTAKRILFGKLMNAGQTCVAPDYVHVERTVKAILIDKLLQGIENSLADQDYYKTGYAKIISDEHFAHLQHLLHNQRLLCPAGRHHREDEATRRQMYPVLVDEPAWDSPLMQEEIFGPVLPVLSWNNEQELLAGYQKREKPLALYLFSRQNSFLRQVLSHISSGGVCINDTVLHMASCRAPFGGVGSSGMGKYHGASGFYTFSHERTILKKWWSFDPSMRYPPYSDQHYRWLKRFIR